MKARRVSSWALTIAMAACLFVAGASLVFADPGVLIPREVFVGDTAEFSFTTTSFNGSIDSDSVFVVPQSDFPVSPDVSIESIVIARRGESSTVTVRFIPWKSGVINLPSVTFKKKSALPPPLRIGSLVERTGRTTLEPPRPPLLVPGTTLLLYGIIAILVAAFAVLVFAGVKIRRFLSGVTSGWSARRRMRTLNRELAVLSRMIRKQDRLVWYAEFSSCVRRYLGEVSAGDPASFLALTVTEIMSAVEIFPPFRDASLSDWIARTRDLLVHIDVLRFSGRGGESRSADLAALREIAAAFEKASADFAARPRDAGSAGARTDGEGRDA